MKTDLLITGNERTPFNLVSGLEADGPEKVSQRFLLALLTNIGDIKSRPLFGTQLMKKIGASNILDESTLQSLVAGEISDALVQVQRDDKARGAEDDESISTAVLTGFEVDGDRVSAIINVTTVSGAVRVSRAPVAII